MNWFKLKKNEPRSYSFLKVDMHNHVLPELDDGAPHMKTACALLQDLKKLGFEAVIPTPHIMNALYPNTPETIADAFVSVRSETKDDTIMYPALNKFAAEYLLDDAFPDLRERRRLMCFGHQHVLVEMSYAAPSAILETEIFSLQLAGYQPVLAHPERYAYLQGNFNYYSELVGRGCQLQLNLLSLVNCYGRGAQKTALKLLDAGLFHWAGTDVHHQNHIRLLYELMYSKYFPGLMEYNFNNRHLASEP